MNRQEVIDKLHDHDNRIRILEIGQAKILIWVGVGTVLINGLVTVLLKVLIK